MNTKEPTPEFENKLRAAIGAHPPDAGFTRRLRSKLILEANRMKSHNTSRLVWRWALALCGVLLLAFVVVGPQRAVAAFLDLIGYFPSVGFVQDQATIRILSQPEIVERDGVTLTVEQAVADSERTVVIYKIEGSYPQSQGAATSCTASQRILLPDGTILEPSSSMGSNLDDGFSFKLVFPALSAEDEFMLEIPCLWDAIPGAAPENWQVNLHFAAADDVEIEPVTDVKGSKAKSEGITLTLDRVVSLDDGYILFASLQWQEKDSLQFVWPESVMITNGNDQELPFEMADPDETILEYTQSRLPLAYKITGSDITGPIILSIDKLFVTLPTEAVFQFDPGPNPQMGQVWNLNLDVDVEGYTIHIISAKMVSDPFGGGAGFEFTMQAKPDVRGASLQDMEHVVLSGGGGGGADGQFTGSFYYDGELPAGNLNITVATITVVLEGDWQVTWK